MLHKYNYLLETDDNLCIYLLELLNSSPSYMIDTSEVMEILTISEYKVKTLISKLKEELTFKRSIPTVIEMKKKNSYIEASGIDEEVIKRLRLSYFQKSVRSKIFYSNLFYSNFNPTANELKQWGMSQSLYYDRKRKVTLGFTNELSLFTECKAPWSEINIRLRAFEIYYYFYEGIDLPFQNYRALVDYFYQILLMQFDIRLKDTQKIKLKIFLSVQIGRIKKHKIVARENLNTLQDQAVGKELVPYYQTKLALDLESAATESAYTFLFLYNQGFIAFNAEYTTENVRKTAKEMSQELTAPIQKYLEQKETEALQKLENKITQINVLFLTMYIEATTFTSMYQIFYFSENYPLFHQTIMRFLKTQHGFKLSEEGQNSLYYRYMFAFIYAIPNKISLEKIRINVDFSQGEQYNQYIKNILQNILQMNNVSIEEYRSSKTDIYLSDFYLAKCPSDQVIWKNPPLPHDWLLLGNKITEIRANKTKDFIEKSET